VSEVSQRLGQAVYEEMAKKGTEQKGKAEQRETNREAKKEEKNKGEDISDADYKVE